MPETRAVQRCPPRDPAWPRRLSAGLALVLLLLPLLQATEFNPGRLLSAQGLRITGHFLAGFQPPATAPDFLRELAHATALTLAMASVGMALAWLLALPLTLLSTQALSISRLSGRMASGPRLLRFGVRGLLVLLRSVPELVWALLFVRVVGLGPTAGVLAIALTYGGMLGKVYGEILESGDNQAGDALLRQGAGRLQTLFYALLPCHASELSSYTLYRWECAVRSSVVLGMVGAGGLGQMMDNAIKVLDGAQVASVLGVFLLLVALSDRLSAWLRKALG